MSNPTTPFSWQMPTSTDLVTDLPADFEVFGQAVATSMADLLGGTTGQVLSKTTNTDMDFTWVSPNPGDITAVNVTSPITGGGSSGDVTIGIQAGSTTQSGAVQLTDSTSSTSTTTAATPNAVKTSYDLANAAIAKSTVTTAGDIIYRDATVPTRLPIGTAGQVLKVNSGATAPEWGSAASSFAGAQATANGQSFSYTSGVETLLTFATETYDTNNFHNTSTNAGRMTIPTGGGGKYLFNATGIFIGTVPSYAYVKLYKNGSRISDALAYGASIGNTFGNNNGVVTGSIPCTAVAGDYFELYIQSDQSTGTKTFYGSFSCSFLGA